MVNLTRFLIYYRPQIYTYIISASRYLKLHDECDPRNLGPYETELEK